MQDTPNCNTYNLDFSCYFQGACPDPLERIENSSAAGGVLVQGLDSCEEACKTHCLTDPECVAVDYSWNSTDCVAHNKNIVPESFSRGNDSCCVHFRKTSCKWLGLYVTEIN